MQKLELVQIKVCLKKWNCSYSELHESDIPAKTAIILELTVCFEANFKDAKQRRVAKYSELVEEIEDRL